MNQNTVFIMTATLAALAAVSGTAVAQYHTMPARECVRLAEDSAQMETSLADAISLAEKHTKGVAIGIRLTTNKQTFMTDTSGLTEFRDRAKGEKAPAEDPEQKDLAEARRRASAPEARAASLGEGRSTAVYGIVTCVVDRARVRDVVVDMSDGAVLGMLSVHATVREARIEDQRVMESVQPQFALVRASELMNATARNAENERVGDIDELVLDPDSNRILYGVLRRGGFLEMNESRYALPAEELAVPKNGLILLNLSKDDFKGHSGFEHDKWPTQADPEWGTSQSPNGVKMPRATRILKATDLIGTNVQCSGGQNVGRIADLIVEPRSGQVVYAIVSTESGRFVVPMSVVKPMGDGRVMEMTHAEMMDLPRLGPDTEPNWNDARWNRDIHERFNTTMNLTNAPTEHSRP